jgi:hypothetical protein
MGPPCARHGSERLKRSRANAPDSVAETIRNPGAPLHPQKRRPALSRGLPPTHGQFDTVATMASSDNWDHRFDVGGAPAADAFNALIELYALFGHPDSAIPLSEDHRISTRKLFAVVG